MKQVKVLIVEDSLSMQKILSSILNEDPELTVIGCAENPNIARAMIKATNPDVITLDVEMPEMDGITFIEKLMRLHPMPVVMCSSLTQHSSEVTIEALKLGAVDFITKPSDISTMLKFKHEICAKVRNAARANVGQHSLNLLKDPTTLSQERITSDVGIIAIGASTGGIEALSYLFKSLPSHLPPIVVAQHLPYGYSDIFANSISKISALKVCVPKETTPLKSGTIYIAPGDLHMTVDYRSGQLVAKIDNGQPRESYRPSVNLLWRIQIPSATR